MDRKSFKSKPYHVKQKHSGEIEKTIHSANTDIGTPTSTADLHVYGKAEFDNPILDLNTLIFGHRISVSGSAPTPLANVPSASVLYLSPYTSEFVGLYVDERWQVKQTSMVTRSLSVLSASNLNYDVFVYWDNSRNVVDLDFWPWSSDTSRENVLARKDGVLVKHNDPSRRYAGTVRTVANGVIADEKHRRLVWNMYNRVPRSVAAVETTDSWSGTGTDTWRAYNNNSENSVSYVSGEGISVDVSGRGIVQYTQSNWGATVGIGINSVTTDSSVLRVGGTTIANVYTYPLCEYRGVPNNGVAGYYKITLLECTFAAVTLYGDNGTAGTNYFQAGLVGSIVC